MRLPEQPQPAARRSMKRPTAHPTSMQRLHEAEFALRSDSARRRVALPSTRLGGRLLFDGAAYRMK